VGVGDVLAMPEHTIHSIANDTDAVALTLHVYGKHLNFSPRFQFDVAARSITRGGRCGEKASTATDERRSCAHKAARVPGGFLPYASTRFVTPISY
jgi:hypothetical protein